MVFQFQQIVTVLVPIVAKTSLTYDYVKKSKEAHKKYYTY